MWNLRALLLLVLAPTLFTTTPIRPHILFIMGDDIGYQDVGFRGSHIPTPNMDRLAKSGVILDFHYVMPRCSPTRSAFLSGRNAIRTGTWYGNLKPGQVGGLNLDIKTVAEMLKEHNASKYAADVVQHRNAWSAGIMMPLAFPTSVIMKIRLQRQIGYHVTQTYIPSFLFVALSWLSLFVSPDLLVLLYCLHCHLSR